VCAYAGYTKNRDSVTPQRDDTAGAIAVKKEKNKFYISGPNRRRFRSARGPETFDIVGASTTDAGQIKFFG